MPVDAVELAPPLPGGVFYKLAGEQANLIDDVSGGGKRGDPFIHITKHTRLHSKRDAEIT